MFAFVIAAAQTGTALAADSVDFVNKDDAWRISFGLLKHIAYAACTHADEHFHKIGTGNAEERHACFSGNGFGQQGFTRARRAGQQNTARHAAAQRLVAAWVSQIFNDFLHFFFGFVAACHIGKGHGVGIFVQQARTAFTKRERTAFAAAGLSAHKVNPHADQKQYGQQVGQQATQKARLFFGRDFNADFVFFQCRNQAVIQRGVGGEDRFFAVVAFASNPIACGRAFQIDIVDFAGFNLLDKLGIFNLLAISFALLHGIDACADG